MAGRNAAAGAWLHKRPEPHARRPLAVIGLSVLVTVLAGAVVAAVEAA